MVANTSAVTPIFPFSSLKSNQREIKDRGKSEVVHITENGNAAYIFCSEEVFEREKASAVEDALSAFQIAQIIERGREDVSAGRAVEGFAAGRDRMLAAWKRNG